MPKSKLGKLVLPKMSGTEVAPGIILVGEPQSLPGTDKLRCLADVGGALCLVELSVKFQVDQVKLAPEGSAEG